MPTITVNGPTDPIIGPSLKAMGIQAIAREYQNHVAEAFSALAKCTLDHDRDRAADRFKAAMEKAARAYYLALPIVQGVT